MGASHANPDTLRTQGMSHTLPRTAPEPAPPLASEPPLPRDGWLLARAAGGSFRRFRESWSDLPRPTRERWAWTVTAGLALGLAFATSLALTAQHLAPRGLQAWDEALLRRILDGSPLPFSTAIWAESPGNGVFMIPVALAAAAVTAWHRLPLRALSILAAYFLLDLQVGAAWLLWERARPTLVLDGAAAPGLHAFPSGHVSQIVSLYGFLVYLWARETRSRAERAFAVLCFTAVLGVVALSRLSLGAHWPSDVLAGAVIGAAWLALLVAALRRAEAHGGR